MLPCTRSSQDEPGDTKEVTMLHQKKNLRVASMYVQVYVKLGTFVCTGLISE